MAVRIHGENAHPWHEGRMCICSEWCGKICERTYLDEQDHVSLSSRCSDIGKYVTNGMK